MSEDPLPVVDYRQPAPTASALRQPFWKAWRESIVATFVCGALYFGMLSWLYSYKLAAPTLQFKLYQQQVQAQAATRPVGTAFSPPPFIGTAYIPRPLFSLRTTYWSIESAAGAVIAVILFWWRPRRAR